MLEANYDFLDCRFKAERGKRLLVVFGHYNQTGVDYSYKVVYDGCSPPKVWILSPNLVSNPPHVYKDNSLCLYYPKEQPWKYGRSSLYSHIIPWTHEWILYYEIWKITGVWEHPEINHGSLLNKESAILSPIYREHCRFRRCTSASWQAPISR